LSFASFAASAVARARASSSFLLFQLILRDAQVL
jgi:hypothetical protein